MVKSKYRVYVEKDLETGLYAARCLEISVFSQGRTEEEAIKNMKKAIGLHLEEVRKEAAGKQLLEVAV